MAKKSEAKKSDEKADIEFVRTDESLRWAWETTFAAMKVGEVVEFEGQEFGKVRSRAMAYTRKTGIVLETGRKAGTTVVRRAK